jgi:hypothetical protein
MLESTKQRQSSLNPSNKSAFNHTNMCDTTHTCKDKIEKFAKQRALGDNAIPPQTLMLACTQPDNCVWDSRAANEASCRSFDCVDKEAGICDV